MQLQVREQVLDVWRSLVGYAYQDGEWRWEGRKGSNSISDAEQLLCLLYPATNIRALRIDDPDRTAPDVVAALHGLGDDIDVVRVVTEVLITYMQKYREEDGTCDFSGGTYFEAYQTNGGPGTAQEQRQLDVVDSFSMSITLCLSTLDFVQGLRGKVRSARMSAQLEALERLTSERLTAAMVGLLRSFSVNVFDIESVPGRNLCAMANQTGEPDRIVAEQLARRLTEVRTSLREELSIGSGLVADELENPLRLFECGWAWGVIKDAPEISYADPVGRQRPGIATDKPILYFTGVALDGIEDLFSDRTRILGLLNGEQQRLATALQLRWDLCMQYWTRVSTFGSARWPIEDLPWRTTDGVESDHFSLLVTSIVIQGMHVRREVSRRATRLSRVLEELANRGRITRRPLKDDPALGVHFPGTRLPLEGSEQLGPLQAWPVSSYSSLLLKRALQLTAQVEHTRDRERVSELADLTWTHLLSRRLTDRSGSGLWDQPTNAWREHGADWTVHTAPSWYHTQRVCECLVAASATLTRRGPISAELVELAGEFLAEAEYLFDQERLYGTWATERRLGEPGTSGGPAPLQAIAARLERARALQFQRPGTAIVLAQDVLRDIEDVAKPRVQELTGDLL